MRFFSSCTLFVGFVEIFLPGFLVARKMEEGEEVGVLDDFDPYLLVEMFRNLDWDHLPTLSLVCKHWHHVTRTSPSLLAYLGMFEGKEIKRRGGKNK